MIRQPVIKKDSNAPKVSILQTVKANSNNLIMENTLSGDEPLYGYNRFVKGNKYIDDSLLEGAAEGMLESMLQRTFFPNSDGAVNPLFDFDNVPPWRRGLRRSFFPATSNGEPWFLLL